MMDDREYTAFVLWFTAMFPILMVGLASIAGAFFGVYVFYRWLYKKLDE